VQHAAFPRIHTFIATSDIHLKHKLKKTREEVGTDVTHITVHTEATCRGKRDTPKCTPHHTAVPAVHHNQPLVPAFG
jgi:hypothetical protein